MTDFDEVLGGVFVDERSEEDRAFEQALYELRQRQWVSKSATRKFPLTQVTRKVQLDPTPCKECQANSDPNNVPVHPGCKCSVITTDLNRPSEQPSKEDMRLLAETLSRVDSLDPGKVRPDFVLEGSLVPQPDTVTAIDRFRFADLLAFVSEHEDRLNQAGQLVGMLFDNEDLSEDTESGTANLVFINDLLEAGASESENSFVPNITHALKPRSIVLPPNASTSELATAYRLLREARKHGS